MRLKVCSKCEVGKPTTEFHKDKSQKDGLVTQCKVCRATAAKKWDEENKERRTAKKKEWHVKNKDKTKEQKRIWLEENPSYRTEYRKKNKARIREYQREYREANREKMEEYHKKWYQENREKRLEQCKIWAASNPELKIEQANRRRARKAATAVEKGVTVAALRKRDGDLCTYCGVEMDFKKRRDTPNGCHLDHIIPLSLGGSHTLNNSALACRQCNLSKGHKDPLTWLESRKEIQHGKAASVIPR